MTLVEVLLALVILGIGLAGLATAIPLSSWGIQQGNQVSTATFLAEQRIERIKGVRWVLTPDGATNVDCLGGSTNPSFSGNYPPTNFVGTCTSFPDESPAGDAGATPPSKLADPYGAYTRQVRVQTCTVPLCGVADDALRLVVVRVTFTPIQGVVGVAATPQFVELTTIIARR